MKKPSKEEILAAVVETGSQAGAAEKLGIRYAEVHYAVQHPRSRKGRPRGVLNKTYVRDQVNDRPSVRNQQKRADKSNLQVPGVYSKAQQDLVRALKNENKSKLARDLGYRSASMLYWLCNGSLATPVLRVAAELEKRYGVRCVDWFESPVKETT